jgi:single-strand DNA-binding protein
VNEPQITLTGNVGAPPTLRMAAGTPVTSFRIGATPRRLDKATDTWSDAETMWFTVTAWRGLAEHCVSSLVKGDKVVVSGKLTQRTWTADDGSARAGLEIDAASVGLDLSRSSAVATRRPASSRAGEEGADAASADRPDDDGGPWASTGETDDETGLVRLVPAVPEQEPGEREPAAV